MTERFPGEESGRENVYRPGGNRQIDATGGNGGDGWNLKGTAGEERR